MLKAELTNGAVAYELAGDKQAELVVLVPGLTLPMSMWDPTFSFLVENGYKVLSFDLYGRGASAHPETEYNYSLFTEQLEELLDAVKIEESFYLYGSSLGGAIAAKYAAKNPSKVKKLILEGPAGLFQKIPFPDSLMLLPGLGELVFALALPLVLKKYLKEIFLQPELFTDLIDKALRQLQNKNYKKTLLSTSRKAAAINIEKEFSRLASLGFPKLVLWGEQDQITPFKQFKILIDLLGQAESLTFKKSGHLPHLEEPDLHNKRLLQFLRS